MVGTQIQFFYVLEDHETALNFWNVLMHSHGADGNKPIFRCAHCHFWFKRRDMSKRIDHYCVECGK
jgi:hypothetical protein